MLEREGGVSVSREVASDKMKLYRYKYNIHILNLGEVAYKSTEDFKSTVIALFCVINHNVQHKVWPV